jgi:hypothetical protein
MIKRMSVPVRVEVHGSEIIVTMPGTGFKVIYEKSQGAPGLIATSFWGRSDQQTKVTLPVFLAQAWTAANTKAWELDWLK